MTISYGFTRRPSRARADRRRLRLEKIAYALEELARGAVDSDMLLEAATQLAAAAVTVRLASEAYGDLARRLGGKPTLGAGLNKEKDDD